MFMVVFFSNFLNHHQVLLADELYKATNNAFTFVSLIEMPESFKRSGYPDYCDRPYLLKAYENEDNLARARQLAVDSDVALFGASSLSFEIIRMRKGKLSFEVGERWLKRGWINILSSNLLKNQWYYHTLFYNKPLYRLCSSAYAASDLKKLHSFKDKCFKWGYFTEVADINVDSIFEKKQRNRISIMWCSRFLNWKHPELAVQLARLLADHGYEFRLDMFGSGPELERIKRLIGKMGVSETVHLLGNIPNSCIIKEMQAHDIFIFTSDQNEGWGAVLNEAMSNGCAVIASDLIGAVPYLINNEDNGYVFKSRKVDDLYEKVVFLINHPEERYRVAKNAYNTMKTVWSPSVAANNLLKLIECLRTGTKNMIEDGPCSKA